MKTNYQRSVLLAIASLASGRQLSAQATPGCLPRPVTLHAMEDCYRPVLVFASNAEDSAFLAQQHLFEQDAGDMADRSLLYVPVLADRGHFAVPLHTPYSMLTGDELAAARQRFRVAAAEFAVILVGKYGGEKFRSSKPVSVLKLDALVDAMPMGRQEKGERTNPPK